MTNNSRLWRWLGLIFVLSFGALGYLGWQIYLAAPPIPQSVVTTDGQVLFTGDQIQRGQQAWLSAGGQQLLNEGRALIPFHRVSGSRLPLLTDARTGQVIEQLKELPVSKVTARIASASTAISPRSVN